MATKTRRKPAAKRSVRLVRPLGSESNGDGLVSITGSDGPGLYWIAEIEAGENTRCFSLARVCARSEYRVMVGAVEHCPCKAFEWRRAGETCKHVAALRALMTAGKLPAKETTA